MSCGTFCCRDPVNPSSNQQFKHTNDATCIDRDYFLPLNSCPSADEHTAVRSRPLLMRNYSSNLHIKHLDQIRKCKCFSVLELLGHIWTLRCFRSHQIKWISLSVPRGCSCPQVICFFWVVFFFCKTASLVWLDVKKKRFSVHSSVEKFI